MAHVSPWELASMAQELGFSLHEDESAALAGYLELLVQWNKVMNLVGCSRWQDIFTTLIVDSLHLKRLLDTTPTLTAQSPLCWDLGAGAGLPGIPLRMVWSQGEYWMIEAREKRALFLSTVLARHPLSGTHVFRGRVEAFMARPQPSPTLILSRAFMPWQELLTLVEPALHPEGHVILLLREPITPAQLTDWHVQATYTYTVHGMERCFCALAKATGTA